MYCHFKINLLHYEIYSCTVLKFSNDTSYVCFNIPWKVFEFFLLSSVGTMVIDFYPPVSQYAYDKINAKINFGSKAVVLESMNTATEEEVKASDSRYLTISEDGSWKTRGHTSQIGVYTQ